MPQGKCDRCGSTSFVQTYKKGLPEPVTLCGWDGMHFFWCRAEHAGMYYANPGAFVEGFVEKRIDPLPNDQLYRLRIALCVPLCVCATSVEGSRPLWSSLTVRGLKPPSRSLWNSFRVPLKRNFERIPLAVNSGRVSTRHGERLVRVSSLWKERSRSCWSRILSMTGTFGTLIVQS